MSNPDFVGPYQSAALWLESRWNEDHLRVAFWLDDARKHPGREMKFGLASGRGDVRITARQDGRFELRVEVAGSPGPSPAPPGRLPRARRARRRQAPWRRRRVAVYTCPRSAAAQRAGEGRRPDGARATSARHAQASTAHVLHSAE